MSQQRPDNLGGAIITTLAVDNLADATTSIGDAGLGAIEEISSTMVDAGSQFLEHIPVLGILYKLCKAGIAINQQIFARKLAKFFNELEVVPLKERMDFVNDFDNDPDFRQKVGDNLVLILDKVDDTDKASLLGKLFTCYIKKVINYEIFIRFASIINRAHFSDILALKKTVAEEGISEPVFTRIEIEGLSAVGIVSEVGIANGDPFPYKGPTNSNGPDILYAHFTLLGSELSKLIKYLY